MSSAILPGCEKAHAAMPRLNLHLLHIHPAGRAPAITARRPSAVNPTVAWMACGERICVAK
jgi:hypothetical protein